MSRITLSILGAAASWLLLAHQTGAQVVGRAIIPHPAWDCGMPHGIPAPEAGHLIFEITIPLERAVELGRTQYGSRRVAVGLEGSVAGPRLTAAVMPGALDFELTLANGIVEIEQTMVLRTTDGSYVYVRNAGTGTDAGDVRVVVDFEAPNASAHSSLNSGSYVARRELNASAKTLRLRVYDVSSVAVNTADAIAIAKPAGVPAQPWNYRVKAASEQQGETLIRENVTLGPGNP